MFPRQTGNGKGEDDGDVVSPGKEDGITPKRV